jgi:aspartate aminotransferase
VAVIQGSAYGAAPFFRMSFATDLATIEASGAAIAKAVSQLQ